MKKIIVRKNIPLKTQLFIVFVISIFFYSSIAFLQWQQAKQQLDEILDYQKKGMVIYADTKLEQYFLEYDTSKEALRLKLNGLLQIQNGLLLKYEKYSNPLGRFFLESAISSHSNYYRLPKEIESNVRFFAISTEIIDVVFNMHLLGHINQAEKNQLLAIAYFKMGTAYFSIAKDYFKKIAKQENEDFNIEGQNKKIHYNQLLIEEALLRINEWDGEYEQALIHLKNIILLRPEKVELNFRLAKLLIMTERIDEAINTAENAVQTILLSAQPSPSDFVAGSLLLVEWLDIRQFHEKANHYLKNLQIRLENKRVIKNKTHEKLVEEFLLYRSSDAYLKKYSNNSFNKNFLETYVLKNSLL